MELRIRRNLPVQDNAQGSLLSRRFGLGEVQSQTKLQNHFRHFKIGPQTPNTEECHA